MTPCRLVIRYWRFGWSSCLHLQDNKNSKLRSRIQSVTFCQSLCLGVMLPHGLKTRFLVRHELQLYCPGASFLMKEHVKLRGRSSFSMGCTGKERNRCLRSYPIGEELGCGRSRGWNTPEERKPKISPFWSQHIEGLLDSYFLDLGLLPCTSSLSVSVPIVRSIRGSLHSATQIRSLMQ